jgi:alanyl-tRNA synthetase
MILTALEIYPHLASAQKCLLGYLAEENERFDRTVQVGLYDLEAILQKNEQQISIKDVSVLENKHGLPLPLLRYRLWQKNIIIDQDGFQDKHTQREKKTQKVKLTPAASGRSTSDIARNFLKHYQTLGYAPILGSSLLDDSIPMSFVMSAGLAQVEHSATSLVGRNNDRFVLLQNCFRHFDLDRIGVSNSHLSFFRMLGAFAFNEMDRLEQIRIAWNLATKTYQLPSEKLWVTYFGGDTIANHKFEADLETFQAWDDVGVSTNHLLGMGANNNFWKQSAMLMGREHASKCGPNSEIFFDRGDDFRCSSSCQPGCACGRFIEFLNMLFITHSLDEKSGKLSLLEIPFTESVVGLERMAMITQGVDSVYEIDSIKPLLVQIRLLSKSSKLKEDDQIYFERILADHLRALLFLTSDGAPHPGKGGRSFLMRRLVRELLVSMELLETNKPSYFSDLLDLAISLYQESKPEIRDGKAVLMQYFVDEKSRLDHTLKSGFSRIERSLAYQNIRWVSGWDILDFEKTYGMPLPLVERFLNNKRIVYHPKAIEVAEELWKLDLLETNDQPAKRTA